MQKVNDDIKVSIVTPSYNQGQFIEETIQSVLNQTYKNIEYILIDGGSTDNTMDIVNKYRAQIDIIINEKDKGQTDAINKGFRLATGELVGWINSDDVLYPQCVENLVKAYNQNPGSAIYYCPKLDYIDEKSNYLATNTCAVPDKKHLIATNYNVNQPTSFYDKRILSQAGYLDETLHYCMDLDLWLRLLDYSTIFSISDKPQGAIRKWDGTKTSTGILDFIKEIRKTILKHNANPFGKLIIKTHFLYYKIGLRILLTNWGIIKK